MPSNETWGSLTTEELAEARAHAKSCVTCGMLATVDPIAHESRYGHAPVIRDSGGERHVWDTSSMNWQEMF